MNHNLFNQPINLKYENQYSETSESSHYFEDDRKTGKWTAEEDDLLRKYVLIYGEKQWRKIAEHIPGRTSIQCLHRWTKILRPGLVKGPWSAEEDEKLIAWVKAEGPNKWAQAAALIPGRSGKQCRERWFNNLNPNVKKGNWSKEEDELIFELYQRYGSSWSKIAKHIPGRTENAIKNRFYSTLRKLTADRKKRKNSGSNSVSSKSESHFDDSDLLEAHAPNTLYKLLQDRTCPLEEEYIKQENISVKYEEGVEERTSHPFNINGEKVIVLRDPKMKSINEDPIIKELEEVKEVQDIDKLHSKIFSFCSNNIKELAETFQTVTTKTINATVEKKSYIEYEPKPLIQKTVAPANTVDELLQTMKSTFVKATTDHQNCCNNLVNIMQECKDGKQNEEAERKMVFLFQQLNSLEDLLLTTKNELLKLESSLKEEKEHQMVHNLFNNEFDSLIKKRKIEV